MTTYEVRGGGMVHRTPKETDDSKLDNYASYEVYAVHDDGTEVFMCSVFGGCSRMVADMTLKHFEELDRAREAARSWDY